MLSKIFDIESLESIDKNSEIFPYRTKEVHRSSQGDRPVSFAVSQDFIYIAIGYHDGSIWLYNLKNLDKLEGKDKYLY